MGFWTKRKLIGILEFEKRKYSTLSRIRKEGPYHNTIEVVLDFIDAMIDLVNQYYIYDFKKPRKISVFERNSRKMRNCINGIMINVNTLDRRILGRRMLGRMVLKDWNHIYPGNIPAEEINEDVVRKFIYSAQKKY